MNRLDEGFQLRDASLRLMNLQQIDMLELLRDIEYGSVNFRCIPEFLYEKAVNHQGIVFVFHHPGELITRLNHLFLSRGDGMPDSRLCPSQKL